MLLHRPQTAVAESGWLKFPEHAASKIPLVVTHARHRGIFHGFGQNFTRREATHWKIRTNHVSAVQSAIQIRRTCRGAGRGHPLRHRAKDFPPTQHQPPAQTVGQREDNTGAIQKASKGKAPKRLAKHQGTLCFYRTAECPLCVSRNCLKNYSESTSAGPADLWDCFVEHPQP